MVHSIFNEALKRSLYTVTVLIGMGWGAVQQPYNKDQFKIIFVLQRSKPYFSVALVPLTLTLKSKHAF